jgi:hypothetical protein
LTPGQAREYGVPEDPDKPGKFQWEALTDAAAAEIIGQAVRVNLDESLIREMEEEAERQAEAFQTRISSALSGIEW